MLSMLEELENIETPNTQDFLQGFKDGLETVAAIVGIAVGAAALT